MNFDARAAKQLAAGSHITIDSSPGLRLKASARTRSWVYRFKSPVDGRMRQIKLGDWPAMSLAAATVKWEELRQIRSIGRDPALEKRASRSADMAEAERERGARLDAMMTVRKVCKIYLDGHIARARKPKGAAEVRRLFDAMLGIYADKPAATLTRADAFSLLDGHSDTPVQAAMLRVELGAAWDYALDAGQLPETAPNWWRLIMRGRLKSKGKKIEGKSIGTAKRVLSESELSELIPWLPNFSKVICDVLTLYLWTASRGSEIVCMHVSEIREEEDGLWWTLPKSKTKSARHENASDLRVPLVGRAEAVVRRRMAASLDGHLFPATGTAKGRAIEQKTIQTGVHYHQPYSKTRPERIRPRLNVTHWAPHDLRRTARTLLASIGCPGEVAEAILGHMQPGIVGVYNRHSYDKERRIWLTCLSDLLEEIAARRPLSSLP